MGFYYKFLITYVDQFIIFSRLCMIYDHMWVTGLHRIFVVDFIFICYIGLVSTNDFPMSQDQFLNQISVLIFGLEIVDFVTVINQKSTSRPKIN